MLIFSARRFAPKSLKVEPKAALLEVNIVRQSEVWDAIVGCWKDIRAGTTDNSSFEGRTHMRLFLAFVVMFTGFAIVRALVGLSRALQC